MMDFNNAFGAYVFHQEEMNNAVSALVDAYRAGFDIEDSVTAREVCFNHRINPSNFSCEDMEWINEEVNRRLNE